MNKEKTKAVLNPVGVTSSRPHFEGMTKKEKGITLIALIITIIVMLILVGVSVTVALNGGLFNTAKQATEGTETERDKEQTLASGRVKIGGVWYDSMDDYVKGKPSENQSEGTTENGEPEVEQPEVEEPEVEESTEWAETTTPETWTKADGTINDNVTAMTNGTYTIPLPEGYEISEVAEERKVRRGLVIKDSNNNEFVWIPIAADKTFNNPYNNIINGSSYSEPTTLSYYDTQDELNEEYGTKEDETTNYYTLETDFAYSAHYTEMKASVEKYDGFYIGRYETTIDEEGNIGSEVNTTLLTSESILKPGENADRANRPFYYKWWGLYDSQRNADSVVGNGNIVQTNMIWGQQWDAMLEFLGSTKANSTISGTQNTVLKSAEAIYDNNAKDILNNIYDLRRNVDEWTAESGTFGRIVRGGYFYESRSCSHRSDWGPGRFSYTLGSRLTLYIK